MEDKEQDDQDDLVEKLSPTLHQESTSDLATTVKAILLSRNLTRTDSVLHTCGRSHGVLAANTDTVEEERPDVADDPAVLCNTPGGSEHEKTDEHNDCILNETVATAEPVTENSDENLTNNDTANLEVVDGLGPDLVANVEALPALREGGLQKRSDVANGEENVTLEAESSTRNHIVPEVLPHRFKRVALKGCPEFTKFLAGFLLVDIGDELDALAERHISPVGAVRIVQIVRMEKSVEDVRLVGSHVGSNVDVLSGSVVAGHVRPVRCSDPIVANGVLLAVCSSHVGFKQPLSSCLGQDYLTKMQVVLIKFGIRVFNCSYMLKICTSCRLSRL